MTMSPIHPKIPSDSRRIIKCNKNTWKFWDIYSFLQSSNGLNVSFDWLIRNQRYFDFAKTTIQFTERNNNNIHLYRYIVFHSQTENILNEKKSILSVYRVRVRVGYAVRHDQHPWQPTNNKLFEFSRWSKLIRGNRRLILWPGISHST